MEWNHSDEALARPDPQGYRHVHSIPRSITEVILKMLKKKKEDDGLF